MFEVIGIIFTIYVLLGVAIMVWLYFVDVPMQNTIGYMVERHEYFELTLMLVFSVWCWPWPLLEHLNGD